MTWVMGLGCNELYTDNVFRKAKFQNPQQSALLPLSCSSCILMSLLKLFLVTIIIQPRGTEIDIKCIHRGAGDCPQTAFQRPLSPRQPLLTLYQWWLEAWNSCPSLVKLSEVLLMVVTTWEFPRPLEDMCFSDSKNKSPQQWHQSLHYKLHVHFNQPVLCFLLCQLLWLPVRKRKPSRAHACFMHCLIQEKIDKGMIWVPPVANSC